MEGNRELRRRMVEAGFTQEALADAVNAHLRTFGHDGTVSERTVRYWLSGKTRCPYPRQREALEVVFGCPIHVLGFTSPPRKPNPANRPEDAVQRRNFLTATTGAAAAVPLSTARPSVGTSDVIRLRADLDALASVDQEHGGHGALERRAMSGAGKALEMQKQAATQRVRQRLCGVAAGYLSAAAWSAIDDRCLDRAHKHLDRALYLAGLASDPVTQLEVWNLYAMLARQRQQYSMAVDAAKAAAATTAARRNPFFASLAHARVAIGYSHLGDGKAALRSLGHAQDALAKDGPGASEGPCPTWAVFYGPAELHSIGAVIHDRVGNPASAEAYGHKALAALPCPFRRNRAMATAELATAQLHQREVDQACVTAAGVFDLMAGQHLPGRLRSRLGDYYRDLITLAPGNTVAREWGERYRAEWSRA